METIDRLEYIRSRINEAESDYFYNLENFSYCMSEARKDTLKELKEVIKKDPTDI